MKKQTEDVFEPAIPIVPQGWDVLSFEQAVEVISDKSKRVKQSAYLPAGKLPVIDQGQDFVGGYTDDEEMAFEGELPVILFGDHTRSIKYVERPFAVGAEGVKILKPSSGLDPKYLYYLLRSLQIPSRGYSRHFQFLRKFHFPRAPEDQQKRIVAEIEKQFSRLDEAVANLKRVKANLKRYKAAVLKAAVEGRLTEAWRNLHPDVEPASELLKRILVDRRAKWGETELAKMGAKDKMPKDDKWRQKYSEPVSPDTYSLEELPRNWVWGTWDQISNWVTYGFTRPMPHVEVGIPIVTAKHVANGKIDLINTHKTPMEKYEELSDKDRPEPGDILITKDGTIGRAAIVPTHSGFCINQSVAIIWLRSCPMYRKFLLAVIESDLTQKPIWAKARGVAIQHLSITDFARLSLPMPPLREQEEIVAAIESRLSVIDEVESVTNASLQRADRLRQSILSRAFSGQLIREAPQTQRHIERAAS